MKPAYPHPLLAREGWPFAAIALLAALGVGYLLGWWWSIPLWLVAVFVLQFFRDPPRDVPDAPRAVVSPADGRIVDISRSRDPCLELDALQVRLFLTVFT